jgi:hypothetical protein
MFDNAMADMFLISPTAGVRWKLNRSFTLDLVSAGLSDVFSAAGANDSYAGVLGLPSSLGGLIQLLVAGEGAGTTPSGAVTNEVVFDHVTNGTYTFSPLLATDRAARIFGQINAAALPFSNILVTSTPPTVEIWWQGPADVAPVLQSSAALSYTSPITLSVLNPTANPTTIRVSLPTATAAAYVPTVPGYTSALWNVKTTQDTGIYMTVKQAVLTTNPLIATYRGLSFDLLQIVNAWLIKNGKVSLPSLIKAEYITQSGGLNIAAVADNLLLDFQWWTSSDVNVPDRYALANTYEKLHEFMLSYLPYVMVSPSFADFIVTV